jgi:hypothetical protein
MVNPVTFVVFRCVEVSIKCPAPDKTRSNSMTSLWCVSKKYDVLRNEVGYRQG